MDRESLIEFQKIDCNCNDCIYMERDQKRFKESLEDHKRWQLDYFNVIKNNLLKKADWWKEKKEFEKAESVRIQADKMHFQFNKKEATINYGYCTSLNKKISFIPNVCQLDTQNCFKHRRS